MMDATTGWTIWLTGLPASGKSVLALTLQEVLGAEGIRSVILDSDQLREILTPTPAYDDGEREHFYRQIVQFAALLNRQGVNVIIAATGHRRAYRQAARSQLAPYAEVWLRCPQEVCRARDPKGLYARAAQGATTRLPGVGVSYEVPGSPDLILDSGRFSPDELAAQVLEGVPFLHDYAEEYVEHWRYPW